MQNYIEIIHKDEPKRFFANKWTDVVTTKHTSISGVPLFLYRLPLFRADGDDTLSKKIERISFKTSIPLNITQYEIIEVLFSMLSLNETKENKALSGKIQLSELKKKVRGFSLDIMQEALGAFVQIRSGARRISGFSIFEHFRIDKKGKYLSYTLSDTIALLFYSDDRMKYISIKSTISQDITTESILVLKYLISANIKKERTVLIEDAMEAMGIEVSAANIQKIEGDMVYLQKANKLKKIGLLFNAADNEMVLYKYANFPKKEKPYISYNVLFKDEQRDFEDDTQKQPPKEKETIDKPVETKKELREENYQQEDNQKIKDEISGNLIALILSFIKAGFIATSLKEEILKTEDKTTKELLEYMEDIRTISASVEDEDFTEEDINQAFKDFIKENKKRGMKAISARRWKRFLYQRRINKIRQQRKERLMKIQGSDRHKEELYLLLFEYDNILQYLKMKQMDHQQILDKKIEIDGIITKEVMDENDRKITILAWENEEKRVQYLQELLQKEMEENTILQQEKDIEEENIFNEIEEERREIIEAEIIETSIFSPKRN